MLELSTAGRPVSEEMKRLVDYWREERKQNQIAELNNIVRELQVNQQRQLNVMEQLLEKHGSVNDIQLYCIILIMIVSVLYLMKYRV